MLASPAVSSMPGSSYSDDLCDGRQVAEQLLFCGVLFPRIVQNNTQYSCIVVASFILDGKKKKNKQKKNYGIK